MIMAILWTSDEMFHAGVGETRQAAADALYADPECADARIDRDDERLLSFLPMTARPTGWSLNTEDNLDPL